MTVANVSTVWRRGLLFEISFLVTNFAAYWDLKFSVGELLHNSIASCSHTCTYVMKCSSLVPEIWKVNGELWKRHSVLSINRDGEMMMIAAHLCLRAVRWWCWSSHLWLIAAVCRARRRRITHYTVTATAAALSVPVRSCMNSSERGLTTAVNCHTTAPLTSSSVCWNVMLRGVSITYNHRFFIFFPFILVNYSVNYWY